MNKTISYNKLWKLLIDKGMNKRDLKAVSGISTTSIAKLGKGENITTDVLLKICKALDCNIDDIMDIAEEEGVTKKSAGLLNSIKQRFNEDSIVFVETDCGISDGERTFTPFANGTSIEKGQYIGHILRYATKGDYVGEQYHDEIYSVLGFPSSEWLIMIETNTEFYGYTKRDFSGHGDYGVRAERTLKSVTLYKEQNITDVPIGFSKLSKSTLSTDR